MIRTRRAFATAFFILTLTFGAGCSKSGEGSSSGSRTVTLYCSVDPPFAKQVIAAFEKETGIRVAMKTDTEAGKTTGLVRLIETEKDHPNADVFWSSEIFNTIKLARAGLLAEYRPPAEGIPERYRDPDGMWTAFGLRGRVIGFNTNLVTEEELPSTWRGITEVKWKGKLGVADPRFGTTLGHFAAFHALWGEDEYVTFLEELGETINHTLLDGNATGARLVGAGRLTLCSTDTDDVYARQALKEPVDLTYPDMGDGGSLLIPNSVALIAGGPNPETGRVLIDFLSSEVTERMLAESTSANFPVRAALREELDMTLPPETQLDFNTIADSVDRAIALTNEHLQP